MTSWRDSASPQTQADLDGLLNAVMPFAERMLSEHGAFYPFGAAVGTDDEMRFLVADPDLGEHPEAADVITSLWEGVRVGRSELRAVALAGDVRVGDADAVRVDLEHADGIVIAALFPYVVDLEAHQVDFGEPAAVPGEARLWPTPPVDVC
jgi:hypothetical protein